MNLSKENMKEPLYESNGKSLFKLFIKEAEQPIGRFTKIVIFAGFSNSILISLISSTAENVSNGAINQKNFIIFLLFLSMTFILRKYVFDTAFGIVEGTVNRIRLRLGDKILHTELATFEHIGTSPLYARLAQDTLVLSESPWFFVTTIQSSFIIIFMLLYIGWLSVTAFILVAIGMNFAILDYVAKRDQMSFYDTKLSNKETDFFEKFKELIEGFKQLKIHQKKRMAVFNNYRRVNNEKSSVKIEKSKFYNRSYISSFLFIYIAITAIIFVVPHYSAEHSSTIIKITAAILFTLGPLEGMLNSIPNIAKADNAAFNIINLEKQLDSVLKEGEMRTNLQHQDIRPLLFKKNIVLEGLMYKYEYNASEHAFSVGPIDLTIQKGEVIFVTGLNGSGKSTFLKMLIGLYLPQQGSLYVDRDMEKGEKGTLISYHNYPQYSELYSILFTDFYLFSQLYGIDNPNEEEVNNLLINLGLSPDKTTYRRGKFTNTKLSSGQKKKLALAVAMLEDRDIYIFDEVASDLDPIFRDTYYYEILPELKARNKTIFVVSHDKTYWDAGDRILEIKNGLLHEKEKI